MRKSYTNKDLFHDLAKAYKDINKAYIKFMRPWNKSMTFERMEAPSILTAMAMESMKRSIESCMQSWLGALAQIKGKKP